MTSTEGSSSEGGTRFPASSLSSSSERRPESKRRRKCIPALPFACWADVLPFISERGAFWNLMLSIPGLYSEIKRTHPLSPKNVVFVARMKKVKKGDSYENRLDPFTSFLESAPSSSDTVLRIVSTMLVGSFQWPFPDAIFEGWPFEEAMEGRDDLAYPPRPPNLRLLSLFPNLRVLKIGFRTAKRETLTCLNFPPLPQLYCLEVFFLAKVPLSFQLRLPSLPKLGCLFLDSSKRPTEPGGAGDPGMSNWPRNFFCATVDLVGELPSLWKLETDDCVLFRTDVVLPSLNYLKTTSLCWCAPRSSLPWGQSPRAHAASRAPALLKFVICPTIEWEPILMDPEDAEMLCQYQNIRTVILCPRVVFTGSVLKCTVSLLFSLRPRPSGIFGMDFLDMDFSDAPTPKRETPATRCDLIDLPLAEGVYISSVRPFSRGDVTIRAPKLRLLSFLFDAEQSGHPFLIFDGCRSLHTLFLECHSGVFDFSILPALKALRLAKSTTSSFRGDASSLVVLVCDSLSDLQVEGISFPKLLLMEMQLCPKAHDFGNLPELREFRTRTGLPGGQVRFTAPKLVRSEKGKKSGTAGQVKDLGGLSRLLAAVEKEHGIVT